MESAPAVIPADLPASSIYSLTIVPLLC